ncbi:MAG: alpha/beta fold hydrolase [Candidatus Bathyarchaeota archaeon]|nr:MAG: alpha/beta fold hydrolase [Candidatus Bathyarchaeota archaeon]
MIKPVIFENQGERLVGILHVPDKLKRGGKAPGVVMLHGLTGNKIENHRLFVLAARDLCDLGFVVLRFDFRGSGDSDGDFEDMTIPGEISDAEKALTFLMEQRWVNRKAVGILGLSMGGRVAAVLSSRDHRVKFVILCSANFDQLLPRLLSGIGGYIPLKGMEEVLNSGEAVKIKDGWYLKNSFFKTLDETVPLDVIDKIKVPILIVHGEMDQVIPLDEAVRGFEIVKNLNKKNELYVIEGGGHVFTDREHTHQVIRKTRDWLVSLNLGISPVK